MSKPRNISVKRKTAPKTKKNLSLNDDVSPRPSQKSRNTSPLRDNISLCLSQKNSNISPRDDLSRQNTPHSLHLSPRSNLSSPHSPRNINTHPKSPREFDLFEENAVDAENHERLDEQEYAETESEKSDDTVRYNNI